MPVARVEIDMEVLRLARNALGVKTNREAVDLALRNVVLRSSQSDAIDSITRLDLDTGIGPSEAFSDRSSIL